MPRKSKVSSACRRCGKPSLPRRATCSDECALIAHNQGQDSREARACLHCAAAFKVYGASGQKFCSQACSAAGRTTPNPTCGVCGMQPSRSRTARTCSDQCAAEAQRKRVESTVAGVRSESRRASRRKQKRTTYRRKDKAEVFARLQAEQGGVCAVCGESGGKLGNGLTGLVLDHCHATGDARALLCGRCNAAVGLVREDVDIACALVAYVRLCVAYASQAHT